MYKVIAKTCTKCGLLKVLDNFCNSFDGKFGKKSQCKVCDKKYKITCQNKPKIIITEKICSKCGILKLASDYNKSSKASDGLTSSCKLCNSKSHKNYYYSNQEKISNYRKSRADLQNEYNHKYYNSHKEEISKQQKEYNKKHKRVTNSRSENRVYSKQELIEELHRVYIELGRNPKASDMLNKNGYLNIKLYYNAFGSFNNALNAAGFTSNVVKYSNEFLLNELHRYVELYNKVPTIDDIKAADGFPSVNAFKRAFDTWNNALKTAELELNLIQHHHKGIEYCTRCGVSETVLWHRDDNDNLICNKCHCTDRNYIHGILDPNSRLGSGTISEHIVTFVLNDCINCNSEYFNSTYDLISNKYGNINVKSSQLKQASENSFCWGFRIPTDKSIPNNYICLGFNENRTKILNVWIIPSNSSIIHKGGISITNSKRGLKRASQYEVDAIPYNEVYQNLDIYTLPEFCNLTRDDTMESTSPTGNKSFPTTVPQTKSHEVY